MEITTIEQLKEKILYAFGSNIEFVYEETNIYTNLKCSLSGIEFTISIIEKMYLIKTNINNWEKLFRTLVAIQECKNQNDYKEFVLNSK